MVKLPSLDELKKMGSDLIDQAKAVKFGEMVDKVKQGIDTISNKQPITEMKDSSMKPIFEDIYKNLNEVTQAQAVQVKALKKIETQLEELAKLIESTRQPTQPSGDTQTEKDSTDDTK